MCPGLPFALYRLRPPRPAHWLVWGLWLALAWPCTAGDPAPLPLGKLPQYKVRPKQAIDYSATDTQAVQPRTWSAATIDSLQKAHSYERKAPESQTLNNRLLRLLAQWLYDFLSIPAVEWLLKLLIYGIAIATLVYAIANLMGIENPIGWAMPGRKPSQAAAIQAHIEQQDLAALLAQAEAEANYAEAVRLRYLQCLQQLAHQKTIDWQAAKTNDDYRRELPPGELRHAFGQLTLLFDYTFYGHFDLNPTRYQAAKERFAQFAALVAATPHRV